MDENQENKDLAEESSNDSMDILDNPINESEEETKDTNVTANNEDDKSVSKTKRKPRKSRSDKSPSNRTESNPGTGSTDDTKIKPELKGNIPTAVPKKKKSVRKKPIKLKTKIIKKSHNLFINYRFWQNTSMLLYYKKLEVIHV